MTILNIVFVPDSRLRICSKKVEKVDDEIKQLVSDMFETMYHNEGLGLAAVQVGIHKRIFVADVKINSRYDCDSQINEEDGYQTEGGPFCVINPEIEYLSEAKVVMSEGCLSIPGVDASEIERSECLRLRYLDKNGKEQKINAKGWLARCFQHEIDHLDGKLYIDYLSKIKRDLIMEKSQKSRKWLQ